MQPAVAAPFVKTAKLKSVLSPWCLKCSWGERELKRY